jgi:hypothetical protein
VCRQKSRRRQLQTLFQWLSMAGLVPATKRMLPSGGFLVGGPWWAVVAPRRFKRQLEKESQINQGLRLYETLCRKVYVEKTSRMVLHGEVFSKAAICLTSSIHHLSLPSSGRLRSTGQVGKRRPPSLHVISIFLQRVGRYVQEAYNSTQHKKDQLRSQCRVYLMLLA